MTSSPETFDWTNDDSIAVRLQPALAAYENSYGQVVIRRERDWDEEEDCFIHIARENVLTIVRAILMAAGYEHAHLYEQRPGGACYDIDWPEGPFSPREVAMMNARPDIDWKAALEDVNEAEAENGSDEEQFSRVPVKQRRARVAAALKTNPSRSNRSIAANCGVSDKTVAAVRAAIGAETRNNGAENAREGAEFRSQEAPQLIAAE